MASAGGESTGRERAFLFAVTLAAIATALMLQSTRVFISYLVFVVDQSNRPMLAVTSALVFAAVGLGGLIVRAVGAGRSLLLLTATLGVSRLIMQFWGQPQARIALAAAVIISWGWLLIALISLSREATAFGLVLGLGLDISIRIAFRTVDLPWMPGVAAHVVALMLLAALALSALGASRSVRLYTPTPAAAVSLVALGPGLAVYHLMTGNIGMARSMLDTSFGSAALLLAAGTLVGVIIAGLADTWPLTSDRQFSAVLGLVLLAAIAGAGIWLLWQRPEPTGIGVMAGTAGSAVLLSLAVLGGEPGRRLRPGGAAGWLMAGMLVQVALLFAYYTFTGPAVVIVIAWVLFILGALATGKYSSGHAWRPVVNIVPIGALALVLAAAFAAHLLSADDPQAGAPAPVELTVMTYNIQSGFDIDNWWSLERTAQVIEAENPDIVVLQEVGRGWLVVTAIDQVDWLSRRLGMPYVFGSNADDGQWGNVILSRAPMSLVSRHQYETTQNLKRGVISVLIETEAGGVWVFGTHLDNPGGAGEVRLRQVNELIGMIGGRTPALLLGDLNADPDSDVLARLAETGLVDHGHRLSPGETTSQDHRRIDYILASSGLEVIDVRVPQVWASDHRPVVARVRVE